MTRLSPSVFKIPTDKLRCGYYTDRYFLRTRDVLIRDHREIRVAYQFFPREDSVVCGLDEAIAILKTCSGMYQDLHRAELLYQKLRETQWNFQDASLQQDEEKILEWSEKRTHVREQLNRLWVNGWKDLSVYARYDGDRVKKNEPVLGIVGDPKLFVHLETPLLGVIARPTATATAVDEVVRAARGKQILFFSARFDHYWVQTTDGYSALKAGAFAVSTDANADYWGLESIGTIPHILIGSYEGDTGEAFLAFDHHTDPSVNRVALVDWDNDCIGTTRKVIERIILAQDPTVRSLTPSLFKKLAPKVIGPGKGKLWGVRLDTSGQLRDKSVRAKDGYGVCPELVRKARREFDRWGCRRLKIVVSGGFDAERIRRFERLRSPVDAYGVGSTLLRKRVDVTADIVEYNGKPCAKVGRTKGNWSKLERVK
ncbi:MAG: nicotinate phosphoribosyltransferase [Candidatus Omnitrophica bacterium]|nr:nicotinate phosphoribosyltransferase [Candidatus Omnitrophota bacterium]